MYRVLIVESDYEQAQALQRMVARSRWRDELSIECLLDPLDLGARLERDVCNIVLMSVLFENTSATGFDFVRTHFPAGCGTQVIYVSRHAEYCSGAYRTEHLWFLVKPVAQADLNDALDKAVANLHERERRTIGVQAKGSLIALETKAICYVEIDRRKVRIHTENHELYETYATLRSMREKLPRSFVQCHQSFLVNMGHIVELRCDQVSLRSGETVPVSQKKRKTTRERYQSYLEKGA